MSRPRVVSSVPTECNWADRYACWASELSAVSQPTRVVAQRLVTAAVTKYVGIVGIDVHSPSRTRYSDVFAVM